MKNLAALLILIGIFPLYISAQTGSVKGKLTDPTGQSLSNATISILQKKDSSFVSYAMSDPKGVFEIKYLEAGDYSIFISFTGYETYHSSFSITAKKRVSDIGLVVLMQEYKTLTGVVVTDASPVKMNGDTISFKANAFNSKPDATVEDVLKKIPGVQVQKDGTIRTQGEQVQKIYVDGKEFFGNDPKVATKNLTADMVDQIQVFDDMSEQSRFTRIDDGSRSKSINIKLKKDKRKGDFGRATAGLGTQSRYDASFSLNHFRGNKRLSLVGSANNTNKLSYTFGDYSSGQGSGGSSTASGMINASAATSGGVSRPLSAGINFNNTWGPKIDFRASYFYTDNSNLLAQNKFRKNIFPGDSSSEVSSYNKIRNNNKGHRVNGRWEYMIDTMNSILYTMNFSTQRSEGIYFDTSATFSDATYKYMAARSASEKLDLRDRVNYSGELLYRKKLKKIGRTFTLGWRNGFNNSDGTSTNKSPTTTYDRDGLVISEIDLNQRGEQDINSGNNSISASYTEPIGRNKLLELNYGYTNSKNISDKETYDFNTGSGKYDLINQLLTNYFDYRNTSSKAGFNFRQQLKKMNYQLGLGVQSTDLTNKSTDSRGDTTIKQRLVNLFPTANFNYAFTRAKNIRIYYRGRTNAPTVSQLQDVADVTNPMIIKTGNPSLKQEFVNNVNINYNSFAQATQRFFSASLNIMYTGNKIVNTIDSLNNVTVIYRPENMNGSFSGSGTASVNFPFKGKDGFNLTLSNMTYLSRDASLVYKKKNFTTVLQINQSAGLNYGNENLDLSVSTGFVYNSVAYNVNKSSNNNYINFAYSADATYRFGNRFYLLSDFDHYINSGRTPGYNQDIFLWNMSLAKKFFEKNVAEIKFTVYDILKQNKGINRIVGENYYEDIRANVVPRFFLLSVSYNLNHVSNSKEPKKSQTP